MIWAITAPGPSSGDKIGKSYDEGEDDEPKEVGRQWRQPICDEISNPGCNDDPDDHGDERHERQDVLKDLVN